MGRTRRGHRSQERTKTRKTEYLKPGGVHDQDQRKIRRLTETIRVPTFPAEFLVSARNSKSVRKVIAEQYPTPVADLPCLGVSDDKVLIVPAPPLTEEQQGLVGPAQMALYNLKRPGTTSAMVDFLNDVGPIPFLLLRCSNVLSPVIQARFCRAFDGFVAAKPSSLHSEPTRSSKTAYHFGIWSLYLNEPMVTTDTRQPTKSVKEQAVLIPLIDRLLRLVQKHMMPRARRLILRYAPQQIEILSPVYERVKKVLAKELADRPVLDFGGLWFCVAVKEGCSEIIHLDFNDTHTLVAIIWVVSRENSSWTGGEFSVPQLGGKIPFSGGQMIAARTRILAHCGAQIIGKGRIAFTCFSDSQLVEQTLFGPSSSADKTKGKKRLQDAVVVLGG
ncbi:hypothetical protein DFH08DRAFT_751493 [Mycena albidolilacea]|uniref:Uncharacterized protein n=1 Tax=Mycena albidolilacea TaxID=1033008 RepID=A0AAD7EIZ6_9AGAR|nr:hypothetical protein DFH08DRAFT_751493 [Mycena albidolilacea]